MSDITGLNEVLADFRIATKSIDRRSQAGMMADAITIGAIYQATVPRDTGRTADSLEVTAEVDGASVGPTWFVGDILETGNSRVSARPALWPAADAVIGRMRARMARIVGDV